MEIPLHHIAYRINFRSCVDEFCFFNMITKIAHDKMRRRIFCSFQRDKIFINKLKEKFRIDKQVTFLLELMIDENQQY